MTSVFVKMLHIKRKTFETSQLFQYNDVLRMNDFFCLTALIDH